MYHVLIPQMSSSKYFFWSCIQSQLKVPHEKRLLFWDHLLFWTKTIFQSMIDLIYWQPCLRIIWLPKIKSPYGTNLSKTKYIWKERIIHIPLEEASSKKFLHWSNPLKPSRWPTTFQEPFAWKSLYLSFEKDRCTSELHSLLYNKMQAYLCSAKARASHVASTKWVIYWSEIRD